MTEMEMTGWLLKAADYGITGIKIYYEGSGDSGAIETIVYTTDKLEEDDDLAFDTIEDLNTWNYDEDSLSKLDYELRNAIENFATEHILEDIEDWWNNEGGYGSLCILVPSGKYKIFNSINIVSQELYIHEGSLIDKSVE
jgi:hypothetical protein